MRQDVVSKFVVGYFYKWILPCATTFVMVFYTDSQTSIFFRFVIWLFLSLAYISIPWNFERPKRASFEAYIYNKYLFVFFVSLQLLFLGFAVFALTAFACIWFILLLKDVGFQIGGGNAVLYCLSILFEYTQLPARLAGQR